MTGRTLTLESLVELITPQNCVLFLGAGASVASGAPTSPGLAKLLCLKLAGSEISEDLTEAATILENRYGRPPLVAAAREALGSLQPAGGLLTLPRHNWHAIYTTNYDRLVELSYQQARVAINVIRSNFDYAAADQSVGVPLLKLHGCITQDIVDGSQARLVLTEHDYDLATQYREALFQRLTLNMTTKDVLVIGHSLHDSRLQAEMRHVAKLHADSGAPGRLLFLSLDGDADRLEIMAQRGFLVATGSMDKLLDVLGIRRSASPALTTKSSTEFRLPDQLLIPTTDVQRAVELSPNALRLFNGGPASYADIRSGLTFSRSLERPLINEIATKGLVFVVIVGVAGVGKTTLARRLMDDNFQAGNLGFEHRSDFPLRPGEWIETERRLARSSRKAMLLIDDCAAFLNQVNEIANAFARHEEPAMTIVLTSGRNQWVPRNKSPHIFLRGAVADIRELSDSDVRELVNLVRQQPEIGRLVQKSFSRLTRNEQIDRLRRKCSADMYVCLKNIFANISLDNILLREFADLPAEQQDIYKAVAALEAGGTRVHRQLLIRLLSIPADTIAALLKLLEGIIFEYEIDAREGLYGWTTRHPVIAERIAYYKYADQIQLFQLLRNVVANLNPSISLELRTLRDLCNYEFGIRRLESDDEQIELYQALIRAAPGERIPRHRLIRKFLRQGSLDAAEQEIRRAEEDVGLDPPISGYKARLLLSRAEANRGVRKEDRVVFYAEASTQALRHIRRYPMDKHGYETYGEVALSFARRYGTTSMLDDAIDKAQKASARILDPEMSRIVNDLIRVRSQYD